MKPEKYYKGSLTAVETYEGESDADVETEAPILPFSKNDSSSLSSAVSDSTIALFGAHGKTGRYFLKHALNSAYSVRALVPQGLPKNSFQEYEDYPNFKVFRGEVTDQEIIKHVIRKSKYVVCMLGDTLPGKSEYPDNFLTSFLQHLYPLMKEESSIECFLFQASSLANDANGTTPALSKLVKAISTRRKPSLNDQDSAIQLIASQHSDPCHFSYIVTRPSLLMRDGAQGRKKLKASKSQPGPFPLHYVDLADFTLSALSSSKLRNTCPYVVKDTF